jgi:aspartyl-tRNA synthetase
MLEGADSNKDVIAFPKNDAGRDTVTDMPAAISDAQRVELSVSLLPKR